MSLPPLVRKRVITRYRERFGQPDSDPAVLQRNLIDLGIYRLLKAFDMNVAKAIEFARADPMGLPPGAGGDPQAWMDAFNRTLQRLKDLETIPENFERGVELGLLVLEELERYRTEQNPR
jgi:hypothetical protein